MRITCIARVAAIFSSLLVPGLADDCDDPSAPFGSSTVNGCDYTDTRHGCGRGVYFCDTKWRNGTVVTGLEVWSDCCQIKALQLTYNDGTKGPMHGNPEYRENIQHKAITWDDSSQVKIYAMNNWLGYTDAVGNITIEVDGEQKLSVAAKSKWLDDEDDHQRYIENWSGVLLGVMGKEGDFLSTLEFKFLKQTGSKAEIISIQFDEDLDTWNKKKKGISEQSLLTGWYINSSPKGWGNGTYNFGQSLSRTQSTNIEHTETFSRGGDTSLTVSLDVEIPLLVDEKTQLSTDVSYQWTTSDTTSTTNSYTVTFDSSQGSYSQLQPQRAAHCQAKAVMGFFQSDYTAVVQITMIDGSNWTYNSRGSYNSTGWADFYSQCQEFPLSEVPAGVVTTETNTTQPAIQRRYHPQVSRLDPVRRRALMLGK